LAYILKLLDEASMVPRKGDSGVVLFLRLSDTGYRGRALIVGSGGRPLREGARVTSTCPVAATQDLYLACTSAGWPMESIGVAGDSQYRTDEIMRGGQPIQPIDWSADHRSVVDVLAESFGPSASQPQPQPQPQRHPQSQPQESRQPAPQGSRRNPRELPAAPETSTALTVPAPRLPRRGLEGLGDDEQGMLMALSSAAKKIRAGESVSEVLPFLGEALSPFMEEELSQDLDTLDTDDDDDDEDDDDDGDGEDEDEDDAGLDDDVSDEAAIEPPAPERVRPMRALMPGEIPPDLNPDEIAQFSAFSDPAAEQKMRRSFERASSASAHARAIAEANERARAAAPPGSLRTTSAQPLLVPVRPALLAAARPPSPQQAPVPPPAPLAAPAAPPVAPVPVDAPEQILAVDPASPILPPVPSGKPFAPATLAAPFGEWLQIYDRRWYSVEQVASAFGVTAVTVRNRIKDRSIQGVIRTSVPGARGVPRLLIPVEAVSAA
jgi:hypothetical protein